MYEGTTGARRLADALESAAGDIGRLENLAGSLYYDVDQLKEDIEALLNELKM